MTEEGLKLIEDKLAACDVVKHPLQAIINNPVIKALTEPDKPVEKQRYIPDWYKGEDAAYQTAKLAQAGISSLPKMAG